MADRLPCTRCGDGLLDSCREGACAAITTTELRFEAPELPAELASEAGPPWTRVGEGAHAGEGAARSGAAAHDQESWLDWDLSLEAPIWISFWYRVSTEAEFDALVFLIDGVEQGRWSGETAWTRVGFAIPAGRHRVSWVYQKDEGRQEGADAVWIDDVALASEDLCGLCTAEEACDLCPGGDPAQDVDEDSLPDACDPCEEVDQTQPLVFTWPMGGLDAQDWVINNYVDRDPTGAILDYRGGGKSYDGHNGVDVDLPSFRGMDAGTPTFAAAAGVVEAWRDDQPDRNTMCVGEWNFVKLRHANGMATGYGHLARDSVAVEEGQAVEAGDLLGMVGSSGCSTAPHLHFEVHDCAGRVLSPFAAGMWLDPPVYETPFGLLEAALHRGPIEVSDILDPPPDVEQLFGGETLSVGVSVAGGGRGDQVRVRVTRGDGSVALEGAADMPPDARHSFWFWNRALDRGPGEWTVVLSLNEREVWRRSVRVDFDAGEQLVRHHVPHPDYQAVFEAAAEQDFVPLDVDGYTVGGRTFVNAIFRDDLGLAGWAAAHNRSAESLLESHQGFEQLHMVALDAYRLGEQLRYAAIWHAGVEAQRVFLGESPEQHQATFDAQVAQGWRLASASVAYDREGVARIATFYDQRPVPNWVASTLGAEASYQAFFAEQTAAGRTLAHVDFFNDAEGTPRFAATFDGRPIAPGELQSNHGLSLEGFSAEQRFWGDLEGMLLLGLSGYEREGEARFGALWSRP